MVLLGQELGRCCLMHIPDEPLCVSLVVAHEWTIYKVGSVGAGHARDKHLSAMNGRSANLKKVT